MLTKVKRHRIVQRLIMKHISSALKGSLSFTCHPHIYPRMEWAIMPLLRKHSPDGATPDIVTDIWLQLTTHLSTPKVWKAELAWLVDE